MNYANATERWRLFYLLDLTKTLQINAESTANTQGSA